jgi:hypothetical protein
MRQQLLQSPSFYSDFTTIREENLLYIDKTRYIYNLISIKNFKYWFLARPRRFGKSLLISTMYELFNGNKDLFNGLYIHKIGYEFDNYPVIKIDMAFDSDSPKILKASIIEELWKIASRHNINLNNKGINQAFRTLIELLNNKYNKKVVVLIDEYDKPILDQINNPKLAEKNREVLRNFYVALKSTENLLHFVFITGISKFAKTAIHSSINNLKDITFDESFSTICGYTVEEFKSKFKPFFNDLLKEMINSQYIDSNSSIDDLIKLILYKYNGYSWDGKTTVLNPFSINNFIVDKELKDYWYDTGPPLLLSNIIAKNPLDYINISLNSYPAKVIDSTDIGSVQMIPLLFQTGYLTIKNITIIRNQLNNNQPEIFYELIAPNNEVKNAYANALSHSLFNITNFIQEIDIKNKTISAILTNNSTELSKILSSQLAQITYLQHQHNHAFYQTIIQIFFSAMGLNISAESMSSHGRSDLDIIFPNSNVIVIELKYIHEILNTISKNKAINIKKILENGVTQALKQIETKGYYRKYINISNKIIKLGIAIYHEDDVLVGFGND